MCYILLFFDYAMHWGDCDLWIYMCVMVCISSIDMYVRVTMADTCVCNGNLFAIFSVVVRLGVAVASCC